MTPAEYKSLPANLQRDVGVALACGYGWERVRHRHGSVYPPLGDTVDFSRKVDYSFLQVWNDPDRDDGPMSYSGWQRWQPTTDTTIWTALMLVEDKHGDRMCLCDSTHQNGSWLADYLRSETIAAFTQGEAVCACFVAADPLGHLGRAGV